MRQRWIRTDDGVLEPAWSCGTVPQNPLADLLDIGDNEEEEKAEEENGDEFDLDDFSESESK